MDPQSFSGRYGRFITAKPWLVVLAVFAVIAVIAGGLSRIGFTEDYRAFFGDENPQLLAFEELERTYTKSDNVMFILAPESEDVFTAQTLQAVAELTEAAWQLPYSIRVDSLTNFQWSHAEEDDMIVEDLVADPANPEIEKIKSVALGEPRLAGQIVSTKGHVTGVNVTVQLPGENPNVENPEVVKAARALRDEITAKYPDIDVHMTGIVFMNNAFSEATNKDMKTLIPLTFVVILISIGLILRGWTGLVTTLFVVSLSIVCAMGLAGWLGIVLTPASASAPIIILTMAVADSVHILVTFFDEFRRDPDRRAAMRESIRVNLQPVFLTSLTTAIGFLSLNFSDSPPFHDLGNICAMGVLAAFVLSVTLLPALMVILPVKASRKKASQSPAMERLAEFVIAKRTPLLYGMGVVILVLAAFVPRNELNDVFVEYFDQRIEFRRASDFADENLSGLYRIDYSLRSGEAGAVNDPDFMAKVENFANWYRQQPKVVHVSSYTDMLKQVNKNMHADDEGWYKVPEQRDLAAQYMLLYEMSLPYGLDLNNQIDIDKSATKFAVSMRTVSVNEVLQMEANAQAWLRENAPEITTEGSGPPVMFSHITRRNIYSMILGTSIALVLISLLLIIALRSLKIGLISLVPNLFPALMAFGLWGILVAQIGLSLSIVTGLTLGIVVDDTVHFLSKYLRARRERGLSSPDAVRYAFRTVGKALVVTSIVLIAGFLVLTFSTFKMNSGMGLMTAITICFALIADFLFLPPLLMKLEEKADARLNKDAITGAGPVGSTVA